MLWRTVLILVAVYVQSAISLNPFHETVLKVKNNETNQLEVAIRGDRLIATDVYEAAIFRQTGLTWTKEAVFNHQGKKEDLYAASGVVDNDTAIVSWKSLKGKSSTFIYARNGATWSQQAALNDILNVGAIAIRGDTAIVGGTSSGGEGVSVYVRKGTTWSLQAIISAVDGPSSSFGRTVAINRRQDTLVIGGHGNIYVYTRMVAGESSSSWIHTATIKKENEADYFGDAIALDEDMLIVGVNGIHYVYVFARSGSSWIKQTTISGPRYGFGKDVSINGNTMIVSDGESIYVYERNINSEWIQQTVFNSSFGRPNVAAYMSGISVTDHFIALVTTNNKLVIFRENDCPLSYVKNDTSQRCEFDQCSVENGRCFLNASSPVRSLCVDHDLTTNAGVRCYCPAGYLYDTIYNICFFDDEEAKRSSAGLISFGLFVLITVFVGCGVWELRQFIRVQWNI